MGRVGMERRIKILAVLYVQVFAGLKGPFV
jgi:hypothetical protein